jgi:hypothetical protein
LCHDSGWFGEWPRFPNFSPEEELTQIKHHAQFTIGAVPPSIITITCCGAKRAVIKTSAASRSMRNTKEKKKKRKKKNLTRMARHPETKLLVA